MKIAIAGLTMAAALMATPALAQQTPAEQPADTTQGMRGMMQGQSGMMQRMHGPEGKMGGGMMGGEMMGMAGGPAMILRLRESLELTDSQVERLKTLHESSGKEMRQHMEQGMKAMRGAQELLEPASPDLAAYEARLREATNHMVLAHTAMARADAGARQVLDAKQRERLSLARSMMQEMRGGMNEGMGHGQDGMKPGAREGKEAGHDHSG